MFVKLNLIKYSFVLIFIVSIIFLLSKFIMPVSSKLTKNSFVKINPTLDKEHTRMLKAADKLYDECYKHWKTEEKMYKAGLQQMPDGHKNITKLWNTHKKHHTIFLNKIKALKKDIIQHIKTDDVRDFHWTM